MDGLPTDDKIQQLVRAVLDAVDARLDSVRHDLAEFAADVERRHHETLIAIAALERRVEAAERDDTDHDTTEGNLRHRLEHLAARLESPGGPSGRRGDGSVAPRRATPHRLLGPLATVVPSAYDIAVADLRRGGSAAAHRSPDPAHGSDVDDGRP